jgi:predicted HTH transcriptional regulator
MANRDIPGYMERMGMGIRMMVQEMRQLGLPDLSLPSSMSLL